MGIQSQAYERVMNMKLFIKSVLYLLLPVIFAGCMSFDYVGQRFPAGSESKVVNVFKDRAEVPADKYRIIGRGVLTGPNSVDEYDRMAELRRQAREYGADALCVVKTTVKAVGVYPRTSGTFAPPLSVSSNRDNLDPAGQAWQSDSFGQVRTVKGEEKARFEFRTEVIFFKENAGFEAEMKKRTPFL